MLRIELEALRDVDFNFKLTGFDEKELARLLSAQEPVAGLTDEDDAPALPPEPVSQLGDVWLLGDYRLLVGDATNLVQVQRLVAREAADLVFTDPPYTDERMKIKGDRMGPEQFQAFLFATFGNYRASMKPGASLYVCHSSSWQREFQNAIEAAGFAVRCQIIWAKNTFA